MAFADYVYYVSVYKGAPVPSESFEYYSERACDIIDGITGGRALKAAKGTDETAAEAAKKAACAQTELLYSLGGSEYLGVTGKEISREEIGNASVSYRNANGASYLGIPVSGLALMYLTEAGLISGRL